MFGLAQLCSCLRNINREVLIPQLSRTSERRGSTRSRTDQSSSPPISAPSGLTTGGQYHITRPFRNGSGSPSSGASESIQITCKITSPHRMLSTALASRSRRSPLPQRRLNMNSLTGHMPHGVRTASTAEGSRTVTPHHGPHCRSYNLTTPSLSSPFQGRHRHPYRNRHPHRLGHGLHAGRKGGYGILRR